MSFWNKISDFLSNPVVRGVSAGVGAAGAAGAFDGFAWGDTLTKFAGAANIATGAASALDRNGSALSRALGGAQIGLGGFNVLQGGVSNPFGEGKIGGFGSVNSWLNGGTPEINEGSSTGSGWSLNPDDERRALITSEPLPPPPGVRNEMPINAGPEFFGNGVGGEAPVASMALPSNAAPSVAQARLPAPPSMAPERPSFFGNGRLTDFEELTGQARGVVTGQTTSPIIEGGAGAASPGISMGGAATRPMNAPAPINANAAPQYDFNVDFTPPSAPAVATGTTDRMIAQTATGVRMMRPDGTTYIQADKSNLPFFQRLANAAADDPMKALSATAMVGGMLSSMLQPSVADIYKEMAAKYDPDSASAQQFKAEFKQRATTEANKQHALLSAQLRSTMADRGMLDSTVYATAKAELDKGLTETISNLDWNAWQAWNQYARSMGAAQVQTAQSASLLAGNPQNFANVSRMLARTA